VFLLRFGLHHFVSYQLLMLSSTLVWSVDSVVLARFFARRFCTTSAVAPPADVAAILISAMVVRLVGYRGFFTHGIHPSQTAIGRQAHDPYDRPNFDGAEVNLWNPCGNADRLVEIFGVDQAKARLDLKRVREVWQACLLCPSKGIGLCGLGRRFHVEDDDIRRVGVHESIHILCTDGAHLSGDELPQMYVVACVGVLWCRRRDRLLARVHRSLLNRGGMAAVTS
jgi:hypothetical protein